MTVSESLDFKNYYVEQLYMSANVETGVLTNRSGRRMLALTNDFLLGLHRALEAECGPRVGEVLYRCGKKWGRNFGQGLAAAWSEFYGCAFSEFPIAFFQTLLIQEFACNGWGILWLDYRHYAKGVIELGLKGAIMSAITEKEVDYPVDILTAGILSGMFCNFMQSDIDCMQTQAGRDSTECLFLLSAAPRIEMLRFESPNLKSHADMLNYLLSTSK